MAKKKLYIDMDGTITEYRTFHSENQYLKEGYYSSLKANQNVIDALTMLHKTTKIDMYIISAVPDSEYAIPEKREWIAKYMPFINNKHQIYVAIGDNKAAYIGDINKNDYLLDDYKKNLNDWKSNGGTSIKLLNGLNTAPKENQYSAIDSYRDAHEIYEHLHDIIMNDKFMIINTDQVQLRNDNLGITLYISKNELQEILDQYYSGEFSDINDFHKHCSEDDWKFVRRISKNVREESNTSIEQIVYECTMRAQHDKETLQMFMNEAYRAYEVLLRSRTEFMLKMSHWKRMKKHTTDYKTLSDQIQSLMDRVTTKRNYFSYEIAADMKVFTDLRDTLYKRYNRNELFKDEGIEGAFTKLNNETDFEIKCYNEVFAVMKEEVNKIYEEVRAEYGRYFIFTKRD